MNRREHESKEQLALLLTGLQDGHVDVPYWLLQYYMRLSLQEAEVMLILQVMAFQQKERKDFPTLEEIQSRMTLTEDRVIAAIQKLLHTGLLRIDEEKDPSTGVVSERYNWLPLLERLAECRVEALAEERVSNRRRAASPAARAGDKDIFTVFEMEFGRPLTPMELESIAGWIDKDRHPEELILAGLKEAVFAGKVHFRYIDRILLEWQRNRITSVDQAKEHSQKFRSRTT